MRQIELVAPWKIDRPRHRLWQVKRTSDGPGLPASWEPVALRKSVPLQPAPFEEEPWRKELGKPGGGYHDRLQAMLDTERSFDLAKERGRLARQRQHQLREDQLAADQEARRLQSYARQFGRAAANSAIEQLRDEARNFPDRRGARSPSPRRMATDSHRPASRPQDRRSPSPAPPPLITDPPSTLPEPPLSIPESRPPIPELPRFPLHESVPLSGPNDRWHALHADQTSNGRARTEALHHTPHEHPTRQRALTPTRGRPRSPRPGEAPLRGRPVSPRPGEGRAANPQSATGPRAGVRSPGGKAGEPTLAARLESLHAARALAAKVIQRANRRWQLRRKLSRREDAASVMQDAVRGMLMRRARERALAPRLPTSGPSGRWAEKGQVSTIPVAKRNGDRSRDVSGEPAHERLYQLGTQRNEARRALSPRARQESALAADHTFTPRINETFRDAAPRTDSHRPISPRGVRSPRRMRSGTEPELGSRHLAAPSVIGGGKLAWR